MTPPSPEFYRDQVLSLTRLPTLPAIAAEILKITRDDRMSVRQILPIMEKDPPLALRVMKTANSAYYAVREKVESLGRAVVVIGMQELSYIALSFSVLKILNPDGEAGPINWTKFWEHSVACGHVARVLNKRWRIVNTSSLYAMGLMHDIGKLILFRLDPKLFVQAFALVKSRQLTSIDAERETFGITHQDVGGWIAEKWELPDSLRLAMASHHTPETIEHPDLGGAVSLIRVADILCNYRAFRFGTAFLNEIPEDDGAIRYFRSRLGEESDLDSLALIIDEEIDNIKELAKLMEKR
ncbi:MAG: HDOD domain-containing protein [Candidatus Neomarinimicrobiota bacterium]